MMLTCYETSNDPRSSNASLDNGDDISELCLEGGEEVGAARRGRGEAVAVGEGGEDSDVTRVLVSELWRGRASQGEEEEGMRVYALGRPWRGVVRVGVGWWEVWVAVATASATLGWERGAGRGGEEEREQVEFF